MSAAGSWWCGRLAGFASWRGVLVLAVTMGALGASVPTALAAGLQEPVSEAAKEVTGTAATLHGELNPHGEETAGYQFSYSTGETCTGEGSVPTEQVGEAKVPAATKVSARVTGLEGSTRYTFCLLVSHEEESAQALPLRFTTLASRPVIESQSSAGVNLSEATLEASVNPEKQPSTSCVFEY